MKLKIVGGKQMDRTLKKVIFRGIVSASVLCYAVSAQATVIGPYTADANTLHLWHMDESGTGPAAPAAGVTGSFNLTAANGATLGSPGYAGFGTAGYTGAGSDDGFNHASTSLASVTGAGGAFTYEALINTANITTAQFIATMENGGSGSQRPFQFRFGNGILSFLNIPHGIETLSVPIPITGAHAFVPNEWFHVAVTYNGNANTSDNFKFFWTRVADQFEEANQIFSGNMTADLSGNNSVFGIGNEYRGAAEFPILGFVDEVRVSGIARSADDFIFEPTIPLPEPSGLVLWGVLGLCVGPLLRRRHKTA
jgi:hypothetical protein